MNKTTTTSNSAMIMGMLTAAKRVTNTYDNMMNHVTDFYSKQLERNINRRQTLALLEAHIMPIDMPMALRIAFTVWTVVAVKKCKRRL